MNPSPAITLARRVIATTRPLVLLILAFLVGYSFHGCAAKSEWGVSSASWMPSGASDGAYSHGATFILGPPRFCYEYNISEEGFRSEMARRKVTPSEIAVETFVPRYLVQHIRPNEFKGEDGRKYMEVTSARITNGLVYEWAFEDQERIFAYDRKLNRAFLYIQTR